jgi:hypothetical protein
MLRPLLRAARPPSHPEAEQITGHWAAAETGQALPIRLTRGYLIGDRGAATDPTGPPCDNLAFTAPFSKSIRVVTGEPRTFAGHRYRTRTLTIGDGLEISGIELLDVEIPYPELLAFANAAGRREILDILATLPMLPPTAPIRSPAGTLP